MAPPGMGTLRIDAAPWGEVVEVVDGAGVKQVLGKGRHTPMMLSLPAGDYTISVRNPAHGRTEKLSARVEAAGVVPVRAVFQRIEAEAYFEATGW